MQPSERILVHSCCASCSSHVLEHLQKRFDVTAYYYNPNIQPDEEYLLRLGEMEAICRRLGIALIEGPRDFERWNSAIAPYAHLPEKSERCRACYRMRLEEAARKAAEAGIGLFTTTLSVSPHKIHAWIVEEGLACGERHGIAFLDEDFKKKGGFQESCRKSRIYGLTRQDYCGCLFSLDEARLRRKKPLDGEDPGSG
jgi:predicted adenine nucleotide alpha hydrolase (AANH) superfamily ATPase